MGERERQGSGAWAVAGHPATEERHTTKGHGRKDSGEEMQTGCGARSGSHGAPKAAKQRAGDRVAGGSAQRQSTGAPGQRRSGRATRAAGNKAAPGPRPGPPRGRAAGTVPTAPRAARTPPARSRRPRHRPPSRAGARSTAAHGETRTAPPRATASPPAPPPEPRRAARPRPAACRGPSDARNFPGSQHSLPPQTYPVTTGAIFHKLSPKLQPSRDSPRRLSLLLSPAPSLGLADRCHPAPAPPFPAPPPPGACHLAPPAD